jgi:hypothetical protein
VGEPVQGLARRAITGRTRRRSAEDGEVRSREEHLTWAKQRALICVDLGDFTHAVVGLRADLAEHPLTNGVMSSDQALLGFKAAIDPALGRGSQALTEWIAGFK